MKAHRIALISGLFSAAIAASATADTLAGWTFEASIPASAGPFAAENGLFAASSFASSLHADGTTAYTNPAGNGSAESFSADKWAIGDYYQFSTSTLGYQSIQITFDQTRSSTGPGTFDLQYSTDGVSFTTLTNDYIVLQNGGAPNPAWNSTTRSAVYQFGPTAGPAALDNQATIWFRMRNEVTPGGTGGTNRLDNVIIEGTVVPEPSSLALLALGGLVALRRRSA